MSPVISNLSVAAAAAAAAAESALTKLMSRPLLSRGGGWGGSVGGICGSWCSKWAVCKTQKLPRNGKTPAGHHSVAKEWAVFELGFLRR